MLLLRRLWAEQQGAVSLYLLLILVPVFLFCALLIDFARIQVAEKEAENAVKTGVRSTLSSFSPKLQAYGLYALNQKTDESKALFLKVVEGNISGSLASNQFQFIDQKLEPEGSSLTSMYSLGNHTVFKKQILEEMKYRAPMIYSLEMADKFKKTGIASAMGQASQFSKNAEKIEKLLEERDDQLDQAWKEWSAIYQKAVAMHPFYQTQLADLNKLSDKIGLHTIGEVKQSIQDAKRQLVDLKDEVKQIDGDIRSLMQAGSQASSTIDSLLDLKDDLQDEIKDVKDKIADLEQLLDDLLEYAKLLAMLKLKSKSDLDDLKDRLKAFDEALNKAKKTNDQLNAELRDIQSQNAASDSYEANKVFQAVHLISRADLDDYGSKAASTVALFSGLEAQLSNVILFDAQNYRNADQSIQSFWKQAQELQSTQSVKEQQRNSNKAAATTSKQEQRKKAQAYLDQVKLALGGCSIPGMTDSSKQQYITLQGDPSQGTKGYYQSFMESNNAGNLSQPVPSVDLDNADKAGASAMNLISSLTSLLTDVRDEFYVDEFAVSKFNYRTFGLEKDSTGAIKGSLEPSEPGKHKLANQELEYLLYGSNTCASNYSMAYAEMFAFRLAVDTAEALLEPKNEILNVGSPLLVFLAAVAEGAIHAQQDMSKLIQGEMVPLSKKLGSFFTMGYKDYLRMFFLLHSRDKVLLSRMQSLIQLNTDIDLQQSTTYISGTASTSIRLWFLPGLMNQLGKSGLNACHVNLGRCQITKTGVMAY
ncbi:hypothetical protein [Paenibacillus sp. UNC451MF]|uniref:hypothetical protein n=1 Tax=Paenibacillus sp. UNC451MF TaxID=1449063 RepID=UPI000B183A83|nr:hypothetical protein [Paenibacillus sp. UNC451MF]